MITDDDRDDEFLEAADRAMAGSGAAALDALGWWDLLPELGDEDTRDAVFAAFRAQGRALAASPALGGILAQPYIEGTAIAPGTAVAAIARTSPHRGAVWNLIGEVGNRPVLFHPPGEPAFLVDPGEVERLTVDVPGRGFVHEVTVGLSGRVPLLGADAAEAVLPRSLHLGRVAAACEILGASERAVALAVDHAGVREQFGQPIGAFQAVRHLLAWAKTDCIAIDSSIHKALLLSEAPPDRLDQVLKALAGRNGRRACEQSLQVLGAIGFTAEHDHHQYHSRVLVLDALLGSSAELTNDLGVWMHTGPEPGFARAFLGAAAG